MTKIRLTKEFVFEMAHALLGYHGPCKNIHGHSYYLNVTVMGDILDDDNSSVNGMVMDFGDLKRIVVDHIISKLDHALVINEKTPKEIVDTLQSAYKLVVVPYQPTCENLLKDFAETIKKELPHHISLHSLRLGETVTSSAEWFASDNM